MAKKHLTWIKVVQIVEKMFIANGLEKGKTHSVESQSQQPTTMIGQAGNATKGRCGQAGGE